MQPIPRRPWHAKFGFALALVPIIGAAALSVSAATIYLAQAKAPVFKKLPKRAPIKVVVPPKTDVQKTLDNIKIPAPVISASASPIPNLKFSSLNLAVPQLPGKGIMKSVAGKRDYNVNASASVTTPDVASMVQGEMPAGTPSGSGGPPAGETGGPPANTPSPAAPSGSAAPTTTAPAGTGSQAPTITAANCAQFSGVPSCSYVTDPSGQTMCNQCKAAGL